MVKKKKEEDANQSQYRGLLIIVNETYDSEEER
jgi:hypothetical protein